MRIKSQRDFFAGLLYVVIGGGFAIGANNYTIGNAARMGPGYFPLLVGILLAILGAIIVVKSLVVETPEAQALAWSKRGRFQVKLEADQPQEITIEVPPEAFK